MRPFVPQGDKQKVFIFFVMLKNEAYGKTFVPQGDKQEPLYFFHADEGSTHSISSKALGKDPSFLRVTSKESLLSFCHLILRTSVQAVEASESIIKSK